MDPIKAYGLVLIVGYVIAALVIPWGLASQILRHLLKRKVAASDSRLMEGEAETRQNVRRSECLSLRSGANLLNSAITLSKNGTTMLVIC